MIPERNPAFFKRPSRQRGVHQRCPFPDSQFKTDATVDIYSILPMILIVKSEPSDGTDATNSRWLFTRATSDRPRVAPVRDTPCTSELSDCRRLRLPSLLDGNPARRSAIVFTGTMVFTGVPYPPVMSAGGLTESCARRSDDTAWTRQSPRAAKLPHSLRPSDGFREHLRTNPFDPWLREPTSSRGDWPRDPLGHGRTMSGLTRCR